METDWSSKDWGTYIICLIWEISFVLDLLQWLSLQQFDCEGGGNRDSNKAKRVGEGSS